MAAWLIPFLCLSVSNTIYYYRVAEPWSGARDMAAYLRSNFPSVSPITSVTCYDIDSLAGQMPERLFWMVGENRISHYYLWGHIHNQCQDRNDNNITPLLLARLHEQKDMIVISSVHGEMDLPPGITATLLHTSYGYMQTFRLFTLHDDRP